MEKNEILITETDRKRLLDVLVNNGLDSELPENIKMVKEKIESAVIVKSKEIPADVVTMNSIVVVKNLSFNSVAQLTLVYPKERSAADKKISIFSPLGAAILGYSQGSEIDWDSKQASTKFLIEKIIYQPESAGHYHL